MHEISPLVEALADLTTILSVLSIVLAGLVLVDCVFLYRRVSNFQKKLSAIAAGKEQADGE